MKADPRRIHELEYELGFRDDPPPPRNPFENPYASSAFIKAMGTDAPEFHARVKQYRQPTHDEAERYVAYLKRMPWEKTEDVG
jgi:histidinol-phosphate/aromatic aminotransferase/cobyric acid decarboxylase-like protein